MRGLRVHPFPAGLLLWNAETTPSRSTSWFLSLSWNPSFSDKSPPVFTDNCNAEYRFQEVSISVRSSETAEIFKAVLELLFGRLVLRTEHIPSLVHAGLRLTCLTLLSWVWLAGFPNSQILHRPQVPSNVLGSTGCAGFRAWDLNVQLWAVYSLWFVLIWKMQEVLHRAIMSKAMRRRSLVEVLIKGGFSFPRAIILGSIILNQIWFQFLIE